MAEQDSLREQNDFLQAAIGELMEQFDGPDVCIACSGTLLLDGDDCEAYFVGPWKEAFREGWINIYRDREGELWTHTGVCPECVERMRKPEPTLF